MEKRSIDGQPPAEANKPDDRKDFTRDRILAMYSSYIYDQIKAALELLAYAIKPEVV